MALGRDTEAVINARIAKANGKMSRDVAIEELAADFTEKILGDRDSLTSFINEMNKTSEGRNTLQKIFDAISNFLKKMKEVFRGDVARVRSEAFASLNFEQNFKEVVAQLEEAEALWKELAKSAVTGETAQTKNTIEDDGVRYSEKNYNIKDFTKDSTIFSYDFLTSLPDMNITKLPDLNSLRLKNGNLDIPLVISLGMQNAKKVGKESNGKVFVKNNYTGFLLRVDNSSLRHSLGGKPQRIFTNGRIVAVAGELIQNAVPINALINTAKDVSGTYAMAAYAVGNDGREIVAILTVEQRTNNVINYELYDVVHSINGRTKKDSQADTKSQGVYPIKAAKISIAQFLNIVKETHQSILSNDVLKYFGETKNPEGHYSHITLYSEKDSDIDPLEVLRKQYGTIKPGESPFRVNVEVPKKTEAHKKVSQTVRTVMEAEATPDVAMPTIEKMIAAGQFSFEVLPDKEAVADAKAKVAAKGWKKTVIEWFTEVGKGKVSKANTALGWVLYNNSVNAGDISLAMDILDALVRHQRNAAQALQATRILKKLSPEGQLYQAMREAKRLEQEINERNSDTKGKKAVVGGRASEIITESTNEAIEKVNKTRTRTNGKRVVVEGNQVGEPFVFEYARVVGENIANNLLKRVEDKAPAQKTFLKQLLDEIQMFANTKVEANKQGKKKTTAIDLLRDFIQNEQFYLDAWKAAQDEFYKKDVDDRLKEFIGTDAKDALYNNSIFTRALVEAAIATDEKASVIANQSALGFTKMAEQISNYLIKETGAEGEAAQRIRDAATAYVNSQALEGDKKLLAINRAINSAMKDIHETISTVVKNGNTEDVKTQIVKVLVGKYGFGVVEATNTAEIVEEQFGKMVEEYSRNKLESMFRKREVKHKEIKEYLTELGRLGAFKPGSNYNTLATQRIFKTDAQIKVNEELAKQLLEGKDENKRAAILEEIYKDIGRQLPSTFADKWNAWRYMAMLANVRTHVRNLAGNAIFSPLVMTKNAIATGIESLVYYSSGGQIERTKGIANKELVEAAKADIVNVEKLLKNNGKYNDKINVNRSIEEGRVIFQSDKPILKQVAKGAEFVRVKNSDLMDAEDALFSKPHYAYALASWCKVNGITAEMLKNPTAAQAEKIAKARDYAVKEALKATFRDTNDFSDAIAKLTKYYGDNKTLQALSMLGDGIMPFRRTPANIAVRAFEYSPVGFIKAITWNAVKLKQGKITAAEFIDNLAAGMTGTMITMLGVFLARLGVVVGAPADEEEKKMNDLRGYQKYSIVIGGRTFTLDWLAPESIPFFMGVNLYNISQEKMGWKDLITVIGNIGEPVLEMSCLSGIESAFSSISSVATGGFSELPSLLINSSVSYFTQAIPTLSGQLERSTQRKSMMTYTENKQISNLPPDVQKILGKISAKIPGWDYNQIPYVDAWGRTEKTDNGLLGMFGNFLNNVVNPAYVADIQETDMELELIRLYDATGEGSVLPDRAGKKFTVYDKNGNAYEKHLDAEEYVKYATLVGQNAYALMIAMTSSADYQALTDKEKVDAVKSVYDYSRAYSKEVFTKDDEYKYTMSKGYTNATKMCRDKKIPIESYLVAKVKLADIKGITYASDSTKSMSNSASLKKMLAIMDIKGLSSEQRQALYEAFDIAEGVRHYTKAKIEQTLAVLEKQAKYK